MITSAEDIACSAKCSSLLATVKVPCTCSLASIPKYWFDMEIGLTLGRGAAATVVKPAFDKVQYWIELLQGKHTSIEEMVNDLDILEGLIKDTDSSGAIHTLKAARGQAEDLCAGIRDVCDDAKRFSRYNDQNVPLRCIRKYTHNIVSKPSICETAERMVKLRSQVRRLQEILTPFVGQGMIPTIAHAGRLQNRHVAHAFTEDHWEGMEQPKTSLFQYVLGGENHRRVVAVVGMPGVGKTSLARYVYEDSQVKGHFNCHAWMTVEETCATKQLLLGVISRLYEEANVRIPDAINIMDDDELSGMIRRFLKDQRRYVIVFDDISKRGQLKVLLDLALPDRNNPNYGRVIVTSRNRDVIEACDHTITVTQLTSPNDWNLFCYKAFGSTSFPCSEEVSQLRERITKLCAGLPLAIDVLSALLAKREHDQWSTIISDLESHGNLGAATEILETSINELPNMGHRSCLLYFSMFPRSSTVSHNTLARLWIAEGFIKRHPRQTRQAVAEKYLSDLLGLHVLMVEDSYKYGRPKSYKVHDLMHQVIQKKAEDEDFCASSSGGNHQAPEKVRRLSIQIEEEDFRQNVSLSKLQTLFISNKIPHVPKLLSSTTALKVLSMEGSLIEEFPKEIGSLTHLRYLNLRNTRITHLPVSLGNLTNLETLNLKGTLVSELPKTILKIQSLHHLLAYRYDAPKRPERYPEVIFGVRVPKGIGRLKELRTFSVAVVDKESKTVKELGNLKKLRRLGVLNLRREDGSDLCESIAKMDQLSSISITAMDDESLDIHNLPVVPPQLQRLYLRGRLQEVPQWFGSLQRLVRLRLSGSSLSEDSINILQTLPQLAELSLIRALNVDRIHCQTGGFRSLKILDLEQLNSLVNVTLHGAMVNLRKMIIRNCRSLQMVPLGTEQLIQLEELHCFDMPENFLERLRHGNEDHTRVQHIRNIFHYSKGFPHGSIEATMSFDSGEA